MPVYSSSQDELYQQAAADYGAALDRLARAYEANSDKRRDLVQEIHVALWRSFEGFDARCSLRTWVYRVAHNTATSYMIRERRFNSRMAVTLEEVGDMAVSLRPDAAADRQIAGERLLGIVQNLEPADRQVILLYLEGLDAGAIGEITGLSAGNVATKIHRIKRVLKQRFYERGQHAE